MRGAPRKALAGRSIILLEFSPPAFAGWVQSVYSGRLTAWPRPDGQHPLSDTEWQPAAVGVQTVSRALHLAVAPEPTALDTLRSRPRDPITLFQPTALALTAPNGHAAKLRTVAMCAFRRASAWRGPSGRQATVAERLCLARHAADRRRCPRAVPAGRCRSRTLRTQPLRSWRGVLQRNVWPVRPSRRRLY